MISDDFCEVGMYIRNMKGGIDDRWLDRQKFTCLAIIGRSTGRDKLLSLKIHCEFIEPLMSFSKMDLYFRVEYSEQVMIEGLRQPISSELTFSNISAISCKIFRRLT